jgi:hypothetical protein
MTGLLLLVPDSSTGRMHVLMPPMEDHIAWIGFRGEDSNCKGYDLQRRICYVDMDSSSLAIGLHSAAGLNTRHPLPSGALNLTRGSKSRKINLQDARTRIRSEITLGTGSVTNSCSVATWTFDPVGLLEFPRKIPLINVLEWQIPDVGTDRLVLVRERRSEAQVVRDTFIAEKNPDNNKMELLIMHVPGTDRFGMVRRVAAPDDRQHALTQDQDSSAASVDPDPEITATHRHFHAFYDIINDPRAKRPLPQRPVRTRRRCPLTILGLENLPRAETRSLETFSCVMASGEAGS